MRHGLRGLAAPRLSAVSAAVMLVAAALGLAACGGGGAGNGTGSGSSASSSASTSSSGGSSSSSGSSSSASSAPNSPPVFGSLAFSTNENVSLSGNLTASDPDGDALHFSATSAPANGTVTSFQSSGTFVYQPKANFTG